MCLIFICLNILNCACAEKNTVALIENLVDFNVEVEEDRDIIVFKLTDPQIIDATQ